MIWSSLVLLLLLSENSGTKRIMVSSFVYGEPVMRLTRNMVQPKLIKKVEINWSSQEQRTPRNWFSIFEAVITKYGFPTDIKVLRSTGDPETDCRAIDAIGQWRYKPAMLHGRPVSIYFTVTVHIHFR